MPAAVIRFSTGGEPPSFFVIWRGGASRLFGSRENAGAEVRRVQDLEALEHFLTAMRRVDEFLLIHGELATLLVLTDDVVRAATDEATAQIFTNALARMVAASETEGSELRAEDVTDEFAPELGDVLCLEVGTFLVRRHGIGSWRLIRGGKKVTDYLWASPDYDRGQGGPDVATPAPTVRTWPP